jgi:hypothetical protein
MENGRARIGGQHLSFPPEPLAKLPSKALQNFLREIADNFFWYTPLG